MTADAQLRKRDTADFYDNCYLLSIPPKIVTA